MIKITVPNQFAAERVYSIDVLMDEILGLEYEVEVRQCRDVEFKLENGSTLVIRDHFFSLNQACRKSLSLKRKPDSARFL